MSQAGEGERVLLSREPFTYGPVSGATEFACGLCGLTFMHGDRVCGACPMGHGCDLVRCPRCGYQFPRGSRIVDALKRLASFLRRRTGNSLR